jgi:hypothetical protein
VHVLGDGQLRDVVTEQGQFRLDAPPAPRRILPRHASDQVAQLGVERRATDAGGSGPPPPVELEALAVPGEDGGRLDDDKAGSPAGPDSGQPDPEDAVPPREAWSASGPLEDDELMTECEILEGDGSRTGEEGTQECPHTDDQYHQGFPGIKHGG